MNRLFVFALWIFTVSLPAVSFAAESLLKANAPIEISNSRGGFESLQIDHDKRRLLLAHTGNGTLDVIDLKTERLWKQIQVGAAQGIALDAAKNRYHVSVSREKKLVTIDREKLEVVSEVPLPGPGGALTLGPGGVNRIFVGHTDATDLWIIDPDGKKIVSTLKIAEGPEDIVAENDTSLLYLSIKSDDTVAVISASDNNSTPGGAWSTAPAKKPHGLALDLRAPRRLFVAGINGKLAVLDTNGKLIGSSEIVTGVDQMAFDAARNRLYCPSSSGKMTVLDTGNHAVKRIGDVATAKGARAIALDPETHAVWLAYTEAGRCFVHKFTPTN